MTPDQLNEIEARATSSDRTCSDLCEDVLALVAHCREQRASINDLKDDLEGAQHFREKAEARVNTLERQVGEAASQRDKERSRVAVLLGVVHDLRGKLSRFQAVEPFNDLDPAATALTERLRAAEAVCEAADKEHQSGWSQHDRYACDVCIGIYAWQNAKGEP